MGFEVFDRDETPAGAAAGAAVVIGGEGALLLSKGAKKLLDGIRPSAKMVELLYDRDTRRVAIRPLNSATPGSKRFSVTGSGAPEWPAMVEAAEFSRAWKLPMGRQQTFTVTQDKVGPDQVLVFDLREANGEAVA